MVVPTVLEQLRNQGKSCSSEAAGIAQCKANPASCGIEVSGVHASFAPSTGILNIPFVDVPDAFGGFTSYSVDMTIIPEAETLSFSLSGAAPVK